MAIGLVILAVLLCLSAFFSGSETALTSANRPWLQERADAGDERAAAACRFIGNSDLFLSTVLVGNNIVNVSFATISRICIGAAIVQSALMQRFLPELDTASGWTDWITTIIATPVVLLFGEVLPKAVGRSHANHIALFSARPMLFFSKLFTPLVWAMSGLARLVCGNAPVNPAAAQVTREDLKTIAEMMTEQKLIEHDAGAMLQMSLELDQRPVETAMVPLIEIHSIEEGASVAEALNLAREVRHSHLPVYQGRVDNIIGMLACNELFQHLPEDPYHDDSWLRQPITPLVNRSLLYVPESKPVGSLLDELRSRQLPYAIVVDEYGGMTGMVATDDLVETIVGTLNSEEDSDFIRMLPNGDFLCSGRMEIEQLEEYLAQEIPHIGFETAAGMVLKLAGKIPQCGEQFNYRNVVITVLAVENHRVKRLKFQINPHRRNNQ